MTSPNSKRGLMPSWRIHHSGFSLSVCDRRHSDLMENICIWMPRGSVWLMLLGPVCYASGFLNYRRDGCFIRPR